MTDAMTHGPLTITDGQGTSPREIYLRKVTYLLKLVLQYPSVGKAIRRLTIDMATRRSAPVNWPSHCCLTRHDLDRLNTFAQGESALRYGQSSCITRLSGPLDSNYEPATRAWDMLSVLILLLPNLVVLHLRIPDYHDFQEDYVGLDGNLSFQRIIRHLVARYHRDPQDGPLKNLKYLYLDGLKINAITSLLVAPCVKVAVLHDILTEDEVKIPIDWPKFGDNPIPTFVQAFIVQQGDWHVHDYAEVVMSHAVGPAVFIYIDDLWFEDPRYRHNQVNESLGGTYADYRHFTSITVLSRENDMNTMHTRLWQPMDTMPVGGYTKLMDAGTNNEYEADRDKYSWDRPGMRIAYRELATPWLSGTLPDINDFILNHQRTLGLDIGGITFDTLRELTNALDLVEDVPDDTSEEWD